MKFLNTVLVLAMTAITFNAQSASPFPKYNGHAYVPGELIIKYRNSVDANDYSEQLKAFGVAQFKARSYQAWQGFYKSHPLSHTRTAQLANPANTLSLLKQFSNDPNIEYVELNYIITIDATPNDTNYSEQWYLNNTGQTGGTSGVDIDAESAWNTQTGSNSVIVAVVDTGVAYQHPDLVTNIWSNDAEIPNNGIDDDNNGYIDDVRGWDFGDQDNDPADGNGHGTHVSGTIAASGNNGLGVSGVSWHSKIMPLKFLGNDGSGTTSSAVDAIYYAVDNGAKIINASWGGGGASQALETALEYARDHGVLFVAAAGNEGQSNEPCATWWCFTQPSYPASYTTENIIAVAATDHKDKLASFSNYGATSVDVGAPGVAIHNTWLNDEYNTISGTSMATPVVSGIAAVLLSQDNTLNASSLKQLIMDSTDIISALSGKTVTGGRVNLNSALALLAGNPNDPDDPEDPDDPQDPETYCQAYTSSNLDHVNAGRAETYFWNIYARTISSGDSLGLLYSSTVTTVFESPQGYFSTTDCR